MSVEEMVTVGEDIGTNRIGTNVIKLIKLLVLI
jgi:hypothetical protein